MTAEIEGFIRDEAGLRGIDGQTAVDVAVSEGGIEEYGSIGEFPTGSSGWAYQLHYGGPEYPQFGVPGQSVMGMGGAFTDLTGWQPFDEAAWRDAARYALNRAKVDGWGAWYGAAAIGITGFDGIDQTVAWDPNSQVWDYEVSGGAVPEPAPLPVYDAMYPAFSQNDDWSCAPTSARWALWAYGRQPSEAWLEGSMLEQGVVTTQYGLSDASGKGLADWLSREYGEYGYAGESDGSVTFEEVAQEAQTGVHPLMLGGRNWGSGGHWSGCRGYDGLKLLLANPAPGYAGVTQTLSREQFGWLGPFSMVRLRHPEAEGQPRPPVPPTSDPFGPWRGKVGSGLLELMAQDATLPAQRASTWLPLGTSPADVEECLGANGFMYRWALTVGQGWRYRPS